MSTGSNVSRRSATQPVQASLGGTSYTKAPAHSIVEFNTAYFASDEFSRFQADVRSLAAEHGVEVISIAQAMGVWQERPDLSVELEPSASIALVGQTENITALAKELGRRYKQYGMLVIVPDRNAHQFAYTIRGIEQDEVGEAVAAMQALHINGGRYVEGRLEIADKDSIWSDQVVFLARRLGKRLRRARARITLLEGNAPGKAEGLDYEWAGPRDEEANDA